MIETPVLAQLLADQEFARVVLPFMKKDYFETPANQLVFEMIEDFTRKYKAIPTYDALEITLDGFAKTQELHAAGKQVLEKMQETQPVDPTRRQWLIDRAEEFCKKRAVYLAIMESISLMDKGPDAAGPIPDLLQKALSVGFHINIGHDYFEDADTRYELLHQNVKKIPFHLSGFNTITKGGLRPKTLNVIIAGTNVGKSLFLCDHAAHCIMQGKNVLYITCEMAEEYIGERIDANLLDISTDDLSLLPKKTYQNMMDALKKRHQFGKLIIKEYPTSSAHVGHFRALIDELKLKRGFTPDVLIIDYINICASQRFKGSDNSYAYVKAIAEELRGLAVEQNVPLLTATQFNRPGFDSSDPSITNTSESFGLPQTADLMVAMVTTEELEQDNKFLCKQLKNRYAPKNQLRSFIIGVDMPKMRLFDVDQQTQQTYLGKQAGSVPQVHQSTVPNLPSAFGRRPVPPINPGP